MEWVYGCFFFFFKQKTAYEIGTGDWSSDVCSSDLGALPQREMVSIKGRALPQQEMGSIKSGGAAAARNGQYKWRGRCHRENWSVLKAGALPQQEMGSIKSGGAAARRSRQ